MGNVAGCHMLTGRHTMPFLIIKEHICTKGLKKGALIQPPQEQGFINPDIPVTQRAYDSLMGWRGTRRHQSRTDGAIFLLELRLQIMQRLQERLERPAAHRRLAAALSDAVNASSPWL